MLETPRSGGERFAIRSLSPTSSWSIAKIHAFNLQGRAETDFPYQLMQHQALTRSIAKSMYERDFKDPAKTRFAIIG